MDDHPSLAFLPRAYPRLLPELVAAPLPVEHRSDCASCPQAAPPEGPTVQRPYLPDVACCTYHPALPAHLVGRALVRGGVGAERIRARIRRDRAGVHPTGIYGSKAYFANYSGENFGKDRTLTCPFWVPGALSCSIWKDRNGVCRTWYCRTTSGGRGTALWDTVRDALVILDRALSLWVVEHPDAPEPPTEASSDAAWKAWYIGCHERLEAASDEALEAVPLPTGEGLTMALRVYRELEQAPLPDRIATMIHEILPVEEGFLVGSYCNLDRVVLPRTVMALVGALAEEPDWRTALAQVEQRTGLHFDEAFLQHLWTRGVITWSADSERPPEVQVWEQLARDAGVALDAAVEVRPPSAPEPPELP